MVGQLLGRQSSVFTDSFFSMVPGAAGEDEIQDEVSSPRITFSHWMRLFLGQTTSDTVCWGPGLRLSADPTLLQHGSAPGLWVLFQLM